MGYYIRKGHTKLYWVPSIANSTYSQITAAELAAGTLLSTSALAEVNGFSSKSNFVDIPNFASLQTPKIPGEKTSDDSSLTFYEDDTSNPIATLLAQDEDGFLVFFKNGATSTGSKYDAFPAQVASNTPQYTSGNEAAKFVVDVAITNVPKANGVMVA